MTVYLGDTCVTALYSPPAAHTPQHGRTLTGAAPAVLIQPVAGLTGTLEGASQISAAVLTAAAARGALVHVCRQTGLQGQGKDPLPGSLVGRA